MVAILSVVVQEVPEYQVYCNMFPIQQQLFLDTCNRSPFCIQCLHYLGYTLL